LTAAPPHRKTAALSLTAAPQHRLTTTPNRHIAASPHNYHTSARYVIFFHYKKGEDKKIQSIQLFLSI